MTSDRSIQGNLPLAVYSTSPIQLTLTKEQMAGSPTQHIQNCRRCRSQANSLGSFAQAAYSPPSSSIRLSQRPSEALTLQASGTMCASGACWMKMRCHLFAAFLQMCPSSSAGSLWANWQVLLPPVTCGWAP